MLEDIQTKSLDDLPFRVELGKPARRSSRMITVSTDGSVFGTKLGRDRGAGGWAYLVHENGKEASGSVEFATNNRMELQAVIEALKAAPLRTPMCIRIDSQYVSQIANGAKIAKTNSDLWREFQALTEERRVKIVWIKGHDGDLHNERVDLLAKKRAAECHQAKHHSQRSAGSRPTFAVAGGLES